MHEQRLSVQLSASGSPQEEKENASLIISDNNRNGNCNATVSVSTTSIASQSMTMTAMEDEMFLLEVSDRFIDISNLISHAAPIVAIGGDDDKSDDESLASPITTPIPTMYPDMRLIDDITDLVVDEFLPTTRKIQSSSHSTDNYYEYASRSREPDAPRPTHSHPPQDVHPQRMSQRLQGMQQLQQYQQQNHSQRMSSRNLSSSNHHDSYSDSSIFDSPSVDEVGSLNNYDSHNDNRTRSLRQLGMTRQQSIMAIQRAIAGRQGDEDRLPQPPQQQQPRPTLRSQKSFNSHSLSYRNLGGAVNSIPNSSADLDHHTSSNRSTYKNNNANNDSMRLLQNSISSVDDEFYDDFDANQSHHGKNQYYDRNNFNHGRGSRPDSYQSVMTQPQHMRQPHLEQHQQQQDRFNYSGSFQLQRGQQHQSERVIRHNRFEVHQNHNGYDDTNRTAFQQQQSHSYRHVPNHTPCSSGLPNNRTIQSYQPTHRNSTHAIPPTYTDSSSSSSSRNSSQPLTLEISPGVFATVRGANETEHAVATNRLIHVQCMACTLHISCIADAQYVLCPICKSIGPTQTTITNGAGGVGLGFVTER